jgi:hypothetical protein
MNEYNPYAEWPVHRRLGRSRGPRVVMLVALLLTVLWGAWSLLGEAEQATPSSTHLRVASER